MPISFLLNEEKGYLEVKCRGLITDRELFQERLTYLGTTDWTPGTHELVDLSEADCSGVTPAGVENLSSVLDRVYRANGLTQVKVAVYIQELMSFVLTSIYIDIAKHSVEDIKVFSDRLKAESWLSE